MKVSGLEGGAVQGRGGKRSERGGGLVWVLPLWECFGGLWGGGPRLGAPLTLPFSVFLKIPCVPAAVAAALNKSAEMQMVRFS